MKQTWKLINTDNGKSITYTDFKVFAKTCKSLLILHQDSIYKIEYRKGKKLIETVSMSTYFNYETV